MLRGGIAPGGNCILSIQAQSSPEVVAPSLEYFQLKECSPIGKSILYSVQSDSPLISKF